VRDPGANLGKEALRVVKMFPKWNPGTQRGEPVKVQFNIPVKFYLEKKKRKKKKKRKSSEKK